MCVCARSGRCGVYKNSTTHKGERKQHHTKEPLPKQRPSQKSKTRRNGPNNKTQGTNNRKKNNPRTNDTRVKGFAGEEEQQTAPPKRTREKQYHRKRLPSQMSQTMTTPRPKDPRNKTQNTNEGRRETTQEPATPETWRSDFPMSLTLPHWSVLQNDPTANPRNSTTQNNEMYSSTTPPPLQERGVGKAAPPCTTHLQGRKEGNSTRGG